MKKVLLTILAVIVVLGILGGAGFTGYRIGYAQGVTTSGNGTAVGPFGYMHPNLMPMRGFDNDFGPGFNSYRSPMMGRGGYSMGFSPLHSIWNLAVLGLVIWFVYWLFTKNGWRITRNTQDTSPKTEGN